MNKEKLLTIFGLPVFWLLYFLFELLTGRITSKEIVLGNILFTLLFTIVGFIIYKIKSKYPNGFKNKSIILSLLLFFIFDQGIKLVIKFFFFDNKITIIKDFLFFNPLINTDGSWLNARFNTGINFYFLIFINFISLFLFVEIYRYLLSKKQKNFWIDSCFIFIFTGSLCSLIDKVFYGGSLDFIGVGNLFIADIKDIYLDFSIVFFIIALFIGDYLSSNDNSTFKEDLNSLKRFLIFIKNDLFSLFHLKK